MVSQIKITISYLFLSTSKNQIDIITKIHKKRKFDIIFTDERSQYQSSILI